MVLLFTTPILPPLLQNELRRDIATLIIQKYWYKYGWKVIIKRRHYNSNKFLSMYLLDWNYNKLHYLVEMIDQRNNQTRWEEICYYRNTGEHDFSHTSTRHHHNKRPRLLGRNTFC